MIDAVERYRELFKVEVDGISFVECPLLLDGVYRAYGRLLKCGYDEAYAQLVVSQICLKVPNEMQLSCVMDMEFSEAICFLQRVCYIEL